LKQFSHKDFNYVAGLDEAGRGCLAGPVVASAVVLPENCEIEGLRDSKKLSEADRLRLRSVIEEIALDWCVTFVDEQEIDELNILNASFLAMNRSVHFLAGQPDYLLVDGNRFIKDHFIPHQCVVKGDDTYLSIAAASVLAKTYRDEYMEGLSSLFPEYNWQSNKGYPTKTHVEALKKFGLSDHHRRSYKPCKEIIRLK
jgi:ribonuclease HII